MSRERLLKRAVRARRNEEAEYGSSLSGSDEDQHVAEGRISDSEESSNDTATTVSKEDVRESC